MAITLAVSGKGGTGKTTFASLLVRYLVERGQKPVLAVDADPNSTLPDALGAGEISCFVAEVREKTSGSEGERPGGMSKDRAIEQMLAECVSECEGFDVLAMGQPEGPKCYCFVNTVLRRYMDMLAKNYRYVVLDNEAGMEHLSRRTTNNVEHLFLLSEPTVIGVRTAGRIHALAQRLPVKIGAFHLVLNKVPQEGLSAETRAEVEKLNIDIAGELPLDGEAYKAASEGRNVFGYAPGAPLVAAAFAIFDKVLNIKK